MLRLISSFFLCLMIHNFAKAELPLFDDPSIESISYITERQSVWIVNSNANSPLTIDKLVNGIERKITQWSSYFIDIKGEKISTRWINTEEKPTDFSHPDGIRLYQNTMYYDINHLLQRVLIKQIDFQELTQKFGLPGWFHGGINLKDYFHTLSDSQIKQNRDGTRSFRVGQDFLLAAEFFMNEQDQVISFHTFGTDAQSDGNKKIVTKYTLDWNEHTVSKFQYPKYIESKTELELGDVHETKIWIREIEINPIIPNNMFTLDYPDNYKKIYQ